jgi:lysophospholipase L1-like esterase
MSPRDNSWTISATLGWLALFVVIGLAVVNGNVDAIADRFTARSVAEPGAPARTAGPTFTARPVQVADTDTDDDTTAAPAVSSGSSAAAAGSAHAAAAPAGPIEDTCLDGAPDACKRWAMDGFYKPLAASRAGKLGRTARVSWYGDSVVATDAIPGHLRARMQKEFGDGGPGYVFVVPPHRFCDHQAITRANSGDWTTHAISTTITADGLYGPGGASAETAGGDATIKVLNNASVTSLELYYLTQPTGGVATIKSGDAEVLRADTKGDKAAGYATGTIAGGASKLELTTHGRVRVFGLDLENATGVVVDNLGVVSANVKSFANYDATAWQAQIAHRGADLIMVMIGANEAEWLGPYDPDTKAYPDHYAKLLAPIRAGRPDAACLVVSPTDQAEAKDGIYTSRPVMPVLVAAQRKAAQAAGCAFFSTYDWMGGRNSAAKWFTKGLISGDFQHLSQRGANKLADAVFDALVAGLDRYEHR